MGKLFLSKMCTEGVGCGAEGAERGRKYDKILICMEQIRRCVAESHEAKSHSSPKIKFLYLQPVSDHLSASFHLLKDFFFRKK